MRKAEPTTTNSTCRKGLAYSGELKQESGPLFLKNLASSLRDRARRAGDGRAPQTFELVLPPAARQVMDRHDADDPAPCYLEQQRASGKLARVSGFGKPSGRTVHSREPSFRKSRSRTIISPTRSCACCGNERTSKNSTTSCSSRSACWDTGSGVPGCFPAG